MYPRNAASPERIAVGAVILIADGTVQTSGVSITVRGQGGAEGAGAGTTAYGASGIVYYTPTQAETDFTSFVVIASKASCIPVAQTIVTSASATPGYAGTDQSKIANPTSTVALTGTTIASTQKVDVDTIKTNPVANGGTVTFPTNATLASTTNITAGTITTATNLTNLPAAAALEATLTAMKGATFDTATDSLEALRNRGDAAWTTATGFSTLDAAGVRSAVGLASANLDTQLSTIDTVVDAIKVQTDKLTFTVVGILDVNIQYVNDVQIQGNGQSGTEWGPV